MKQRPPDPKHPTGYCIFCDHQDEDYRDEHFWSKFDYEHDCLCMCHVLNDEIAERQLLKMRFDTISKFCDKCNLSYPYYTLMCIRCHSTKLREFKIHNNMEELQRNWKERWTDKYLSKFQKRTER